MSSSNDSTRTVRFALDNNQVHSVEKIDPSEAIDLFYQPEDYLQFRADYNAFKAKLRMERKVQQFDKMVAQAKMGGIMAPMPLLPSQMQKSMEQRGCARMA